MSDSVSEYRTVDVPVRGGDLRVGVWGELTTTTPVVLALHGITSSHRAWPLVAEHVAGLGAAVVAPDLRARGRSSALPAPYGMEQHVDDLVAVLDRLAPGRPVVVAGHSTGGFVAVVLAARRPDLVAHLVLVDGGVPLVLPAGTTLPELARRTLGPAAERLETVYADRAEYRRFWEGHPAIDELTPTLRAYVDYDLERVGDHWRCSASAEAMYADHAEQFEGGPVDRAWADVRAEVTFLRAPRGLLAEPGGLYPEPVLARWMADHPAVAYRTVPDVNHYTIVLGAEGARQVADALAGPLGATHPPLVRTRRTA